MYWLQISYVFSQDTELMSFSIVWFIFSIFIIENLKFYFDKRKSHVYYKGFLLIYHAKSK